MHVGCPTCQSLIAAVIAQPDDDLPRLTYADHLGGEHADEKSCMRAEFIRVQIDLWRLPRDRGLSSRWSMLTRRDYELQRWLFNDVRLAVFPDGDDVEVLWLYQRGFVEVVTCSWAQFRPRADAMRAATPLRQVRLTTWPLVHLNTIRTLDAGDYYVARDEGLPFFGMAPTPDVAILNGLKALWPTIAFTLPIDTEVPPSRAGGVTASPPAGWADRLRRLASDAASRDEP